MLLRNTLAPYLLRKFYFQSAIDKELIITVQLKNINLSVNKEQQIVEIIDIERFNK